jgi:hypothetical protein
MRLMLAFNRNMLALFLVANLLTGAVNLSVNTLAMGSWAARIIVGKRELNNSPPAAVAGGWIIVGEWQDPQAAAAAAAAAVSTAGCLTL